MRPMTGRRRDQILRLRYGADPGTHERLMQEQHGGCAVCGATPPDHESLCLDHHHDSGKIRGLLCRPCNFLIGHAGDDPQRLRLAADYLEQRDPLTKGTR